jgi:hypothetical protein
MQQRVLLALGAACVLGACDGQRLPSAPIVIGGSTGASVRLVNASVNVSALDLAIGGTVATSDDSVAFGSATGCRAVSPGSLVAVRLAGSASDLPGFTSGLTSGQRATVVAAGPTDSLRFVTLYDDTNLPAAGRARLRVLNASRNDDVDVRLVAPGSSSATTIVAGLDVDDVSSFVDLPAGTALLDVLTSGGAVLLDDATVTLGTGESRTVVLGEPVSGSATLQFFHFAACP